MYASVSGGYRNYATGTYSVVGGGQADSAKGLYSGSLSGSRNLAGSAATDTGAVVCGGVNNAATNKYAVVCGGVDNIASGGYATVSGGFCDTASGYYATVSGGRYNIAGNDASVVGGYNNTASGDLSSVVGGAGNNASATAAVVAGGEGCMSSGSHATVGGGMYNSASGQLATVGGGYLNRATNQRATIGGGFENTASGAYATVAGGYADTTAAWYGFTTGNHSVVPFAHTNSAAFNGQVSTASGQTRVGALSKASGTFTIDHPRDPMNKILNHYFVESPEMVLIYRGIAVIGAGGRAEVQLPDYYDTLNKNPQIQLTGVGTYEVYVAEKVNGNRFVIGGKPGTEVHWVVTGERKDPSAEITKIIMPVEQAKDGDLAGRSLDDDFLVTTKEQLERMGKASGFNFRLPANQQRYEDMKRMVTENR